MRVKGMSRGRKTWVESEGQNMDKLILKQE